MATPRRTLEQRIYDRDFRRLSALSVLGISMAGLLLVGTILFAGWAANDSATRRERTQLQNALNRGIARALNEQKSVAWWDEAVTKIQPGAIDFEFADSEFGVFLTETYGHDQVYILSGEDVPIYAFRDGARGEPGIYNSVAAALKPVVAEIRGEQDAALKARPDTFGADQRDYRTLGGVLDLARWAGHIIPVEGRLAVVAALTIVPNVEVGLLAGRPTVLISVIYIDDNYVGTIGQSLMLADLSISDVPAARDGLVFETIESDDGSHTSYLSWTTERPGRVLYQIILPLVSIGVFATAMLAMRMLRRLKDASKTLADREQQSRHAARHDALSGLPNRAHFAEKLGPVLATLGREPGNRRVIAAYTDIDHFKDVNDTLGHHAGDDLIELVAGRLRERLRPGEFLARYGGDEFALISETDASDSGQRLAAAIQKAFAAPFNVAGQSLFVTASTGIASAPDHGESVDELMRHADIALYEAKARGRNRAVFYSEEMGREVEERRQVELDLRTALDSGALRLNYQPIMSCHTGRIAGVEALLRWRHPVRGEMAPAKFIPIAEQSGLMPALGEWVLRQAMADSRLWPDLYVSINMSPVQFRQADIELLLEQLLSEYGVAPERFILEITEGVLLEANARTSETLDSIHAMGFKTALDDFGTGYSSLSYLCSFRFDKIKIDRSFVRGMSKSEGYRKIVNAVVALGRGLGMEIVAEGVETEAEAKIMREFGCSELQGYYFSRPLELELLLDFISAADDTARDSYVSAPLLKVSAARTG